LIECNEIPNDRSEIPSPSAVLRYPHLKSVAHLIPDIDPDAHILLLLGRDILRVQQDGNFLRFLWFRDNDPSKDIMEYCMKVHVFGNSPSPTVAIYGLRKAAHLEGKEQDSEVQQFVERDFYVDDGLKSLPTVEATVNLLKRTQNILARSK
ncbi:hypothetical protein QTP86_016535, partial [Hemibagrus guttatus]